MICIHYSTTKHNPKVTLTKTMIDRVAEKCMFMSHEKYKHHIYSTIWVKFTKLYHNQTGTWLMLKDK